MVTYYAKRALEILREEGPVEMSKAMSRFLFGRKFKGWTNSVVLFYYRNLYRIHYGDLAPSPDKLIQVNPCNINKSVHWVIKDYKVGRTKYFNSHLQANGSFVLEGDWDLRAKAFSEVKKVKYQHIYNGIHSRYEHNIAWDQTELHQFLVESDISDDRYQNPRKRYGELEDLFETLKSEGYMTQTELTKQGEINESDSEISIAISRDGTLLWLKDGFHRLQMAKVINLESIPVRVGARHKQWQELRGEIDKHGLPEGREDLRDHPDLQDILD